MPEQRTASVTTLPALLAEVIALGIGLRRVSARRQNQGALAAGERSVLDILERFGPQTVPQMARLRCTSRQNIQILANRLLANGLVRLTSNPAHKRSVLVTLTNRGREMVAKSAQQESEYLRSLAAGVPNSKISMATEVLGEIRALLAGTAGSTRKLETRIRRRVVRRGPKGSEKQFVTTTAETNIVSSPSEPDFEPGELPVNLL